jgi:hypothetical protein
VCNYCTKALSTQLLRPCRKTILAEYWIREFSVLKDTMHSEILNEYFTDNQMAAVLGMSLGGLRNKVYRQQKGALPESSQLLRDRFWEKAKVKEWLLKQVSEPVAADLMRRGEIAAAKAPKIGQSDAAS